MSNEIIKVLDAICDKFGLAIDWTSQNVMPYVEQLCEHIVQYELVSSSIYTVLSLVILIVGTVLCIRMFKKIFKSSLYEFDKVGAYSCTIFLLVVIYLIFFPILITQFEDAITSLLFFQLLKTWQLKKDVRITFQKKLLMLLFLKNLKQQQKC